MFEHIPIYVPLALSVGLFVLGYFWKLPKTDPVTGYTNELPVAYACMFFMWVVWLGLTFF